MGLFTNYNWKVFGVLVLLGFSAYTVQILVNIPTIKAQGFTAFQVVTYVAPYFIGILLTLFIGFLAAAKTGFETPLINAWLDHKTPKGYSKTILISVALGTITAILLLVLDYLVFGGLVESKIKSMGNSVSRLALAYGAAVGEELLFRLFVMSCTVWISNKLIGSIKTSVWIGIIISSLLFGVGHFPREVESLTTLIIVRALLLNGIIGIVLGWLYWRKGLEAAILAHFPADLVIYVVFPMFL